MPRRRRAGRWGRPLALAAALLLFAAYAGATVASYVEKRPSPALDDFAEDFEGRDIGAWTAVGEAQVCCADSVALVTDPVRSGRQSLRLRLRMADPKVEGSRRVELRLPSVHLGDEFWYALSVFVPADWASDDVPVTVAQWHGAPDTFLLEGHQPPPLRLNVVGDRWLVAKAWDARRWSGPMLRHLEPQGGALLLTAPLDKGRWVDWLFRVRWSYGADGLVEVWKDGARVASSAGPNAYNDWLAPYFKAGIYIPAWAKDGARADVASRWLALDRIRQRRAGSGDAPPPDLMAPSPGDGAR